MAGGVADLTHREMLDTVVTDELAGMSRLDYVYGAVSIAERENWPLIGLSTTRRALNVLCKRYNDIDIQCLACFVCGQLRTTCAGYSSIHLDNPVNSEQDCFNTEIYWKSVQDLQKLEQNPFQTHLEEVEGT